MATKPASLPAQERCLLLPNASSSNLPACLKSARREGSLRSPIHRHHLSCGWPSIPLKSHRSMLTSYTPLAPSPLFLQGHWNLDHRSPSFVGTASRFSRGWIEVSCRFRVPCETYITVYSTTPNFSKPDTTLLRLPRPERRKGKDNSAEFEALRAPFEGENWSLRAA